MGNGDYIKKWLEGSLTEEEKKTFENTEDYKKIIKLTESVKAFKAPKYDQEAEWQRFKTSIPGKRAKVVKVNWKAQILRVAAVIFILVSVFIFLFSNRATTITTSLAEKETVMLPDSSLVILNSNSSITYYRRGWNRKREVTLNGEAFFKVSKGSTFQVIAGDGLVEVLGTEFNVKTRDKYFEVICYEGLVQVQKNKSIVKLPAEHIFLSLNGKTIIEKERYSDSPHLLADESAFYSVPYKEVIEEFERQYKIDISAPNIDLDQRFTGKFTHSDMELALKSITIPLNLSYKKTDNKKFVLTKEL